MRSFFEMLFCGAGDKTVADCKTLHDSIDKALNYLSGTQQGPHWQSPPSPKMLDDEKKANQEAHQICEDVARDVAMALTGKEIVLQPIKNKPPPIDDWLPDVEKNLRKLGFEGLLWTNEEAIFADDRRVAKHFRGTNYRDMDWSPYSGIHPRDEMVKIISEQISYELNLLPWEG